MNSDKGPGVLEGAMQTTRKFLSVGIGAGLLATSTKKFRVLTAIKGNYDDARTECRQSGERV